MCFLPFPTSVQIDFLNSKLNRNSFFEYEHTFYLDISLERSRMSPSFLQFFIFLWIAFEILAYLSQPQGAKCTKTHTFLILSFSMSIPFTFILPLGGKTNPLLVANEPFQRMRGQKWPHASCNSLLLFGLLLKSLVSNSIWHTRPS